MAQVLAAWGSLPHPVSRLVYTLIFMVFVLGTAIIAVRRTSRNRLFSQVVTTLGVFLLIIGTMVYTVAFRGLQFAEMAQLDRFSCRDLLVSRADEPDREGGDRAETRCHEGNRDTLPGNH